MTPALEQLSELVRQAEARSRSKKVEAEVKVAAESLKEAEARASVAVRKLREGRAAKVKQLEQADADEHQLKELVKKLAQYKSALDASSGAENLIDAARAEIEQARQAARTGLDGLAREADEARRALRSAVDHYHQLRRELDRLQPGLGAAYAACDRIAWDAETLFPGGALNALAREVEAGVPAYGSLTRPEQYAQLKVWIGRYRQLQDAHDPDGEAPPSPEDAQAQAQRVFLQLKTLSKQYEPGYIDAFRLDFQADWPLYIADAQAQLRQVAEAPRPAPPTPTPSPTAPGRGTGATQARSA